VNPACIEVQQGQSGNEFLIFSYTFTIAKPERSADVLEDAFSWARLKSYRYFSLIESSPRCLKNENKYL